MTVTCSQADLSAEITAAHLVSHFHIMTVPALLSLLGEGWAAVDEDATSYRWTNRELTAMRFQMLMVPIATMSCAICSSEKC
ncbi:MAG: hypothetical protein AMXMBFR74_06230 [Parvibaculum sp.]